MLKLKFFSVVSIFILILSSCEFVEDESITPIDETSIPSEYQFTQDSVIDANDINFTQLPDENSTGDYEAKN
ncbi:hypothetical protein [Flammeovirga sp. OC4]|uniref:hypothetical protein n=1 Tax=Flammeovirga sp. OC4 TaxID=1382345 RepID=UPI0005C645FE|nr:hypothetical protein [Flammeovirga sp. OC4]